MTGLFCLVCEEVRCHDCHLKYLESDQARNEEFICNCTFLEARHKREAAEGKTRQKDRPYGLFVEINVKNAAGKLGFKDF